MMVLHHQKSIAGHVLDVPGEAGRGSSFHALNENQLDPSISLLAIWAIIQTCLGV